MRRICMYCKEVFGYKCRVCGAELDPKQFSWPDQIFGVSVDATKIISICQNCEAVITLGSGDDSHGLCLKSECRDKAAKDMLLSPEQVVTIKERMLKNAS